MNEQADQVLGADAGLLEDAAGALRPPAASSGGWRLAAAALAGGAASWLRRFREAGRGGAEDEPPDLPDLLG